jgi:hypothetical protein
LPPVVFNVLLCGFGGIVEMAETASDKYVRVCTMISDDGDTWDLSANDKEALRHVLGMADAYVQLVNTVRHAIDYAGGRESEWGERAEGCFRILERGIEAKQC